LPGKKERGFVIGGKKWIYFDNLKRRKTICDPGQSSTTISKTQYLWKNGRALYLVGPEEGLL